MFLFPILVKPSNINQGKLEMQLPKNYQDYGDVFNELKANTLPEFWLYDCPINLQPIKEPPWGSEPTTTLFKCQTFNHYDSIYDIQ